MKVKLTTKTDTLWLITTFFGDHYEPIQSLLADQKLYLSIWLEVQEKIRKKSRANMIAGKNGCNFKDNLTLKYHEAYVLHKILIENTDINQFGGDYEKGLMRDFIGDLNQKLS
jgi:hypothetical protein